MVLGLKNKRALIIAPFSPKIVGGISTWTKNMLDYKRIKHDSNFEVYFYANHFIRETNDIFLLRVISGILVYAKLVTEVSFIIFKKKPNILHIASSASFGLFKDYLFYLIGRIAGIPVVFHWRFGRIPLLEAKKNWEWKVLFSLMLKSYSNILIDIESYNSLEKTGLTNISYIPNPVGIEIENKSREMFESSYFNIKKKARIPGLIIFVGHIIRAKGVFDLVEAVVPLKNVTQLCMIGPYEEDIKNELMRISLRRGTSSWLKFTGIKPRENVLEYMMQAQVLIIPSYTEGCPNVVLEAMAMGCPIIGTNVGDIPELLGINSDYPCGICIEPHSIDKLRGSVQDLLQNSKLRCSMGESGINRILTNYTLDKAVERYKCIWNGSTKTPQSKRQVVD